MDRKLFCADIAKCVERMGVSLPRGARVLITGVTGLVGTAFYETLRRLDARDGLALKLYGLTRDPERAAERFPDGGITLIRGDITCTAHELPACDYIIHAASNAHPAAFTADPVGTMLANIEGTRMLLEHIRQQGHGRLLFLSSGEIYGEDPNLPNGFSETDMGRVDPMRFRACYPEGKRAAETLCASYAHQYGVDVVVARLCYVFGPTITASNSRADAQFLRKAMAGEDIVLKSTGTQERSYCYAPDAAAALATILVKGQTANAYNIALPEETLTIRAYAETLAEAAGVKVVFDLPPEAERAGYSTVSRAVQDPSKLMALGWMPVFTAREGLKHTYEAMRV